MLWKEAWCKAFLAREARGGVKRSAQSVQDAMEALRAEVDRIDRARQSIGGRPRAGKARALRDMPHPRTLLRWVRAYERDGASPLALPRRPRARDSYWRKMEGRAEALLGDCVKGYLSRQCPTARAVAADTRERFEDENRAREAEGLTPLPVPSARTVIREIQRLPAFEKHAARKGMDAARRKFGFIEGGVAAGHPLERVEIDEWQIDVLSLFRDGRLIEHLTGAEQARYDIGRRWLYLAIDVATRCVVGFKLSRQPCAEDAVRVLDLITRDKTGLARAAGCESGWEQYGGLGAVVTDQGSAFASESFRAAVVEAGGRYEAPPAGVPKLRGHVERFFGTCSRSLATELTGRAFSNPQERGDYPSEQLAVLGDADLSAILVSFIVDGYHNSPHAGLLGETPADAWARLTAERGCAPPPDPLTRRVAFGLPLRRQIGRHGLRVLAIDYASHALRQRMLRDDRAVCEIRVDPLDLSHIAVEIDPGAWALVEARQDGFAGVSIAEWSETVRGIQLRNRALSAVSSPIVRRALARIREIDRAARERARVGPHSLSAEDLGRLKASLFLGLTIDIPGDVPGGASETAPAPGGLLRDVIPPAEARTMPEPPAPPVSPPWRIEDE